MSRANEVSTSVWQRGSLLAGCLLLALPLTHCATNPATGKKQLALISEAQEIEIGRGADQQVVAQYGLYPDQQLQDYVQRLGSELARSSERPHLPWTFRVVDDPVVNAFALPGGYIYITRGILSHMSSEAELVAVLGHEIGHVTARHGVNQMSKAQLANIGLGVGMILSPELGRYGQELQQGLGLMFLKFGRDDERQADDLGYRYATGRGYPPGAMAEMFSTLNRVGNAATAKSGSGRLPNWLSTHPNPVDRRQRVEERMAAAPPEVLAASWNRAPYFDRLQNLTYGANPREGFFRDSRFYHPEMAFQVDLPPGWTTQNSRQAVVAVSPKKDAYFQLSLAQQNSPDSASQAFFQQQGVEVGNTWVRSLRGSVARTFRAQVSQTQQLDGGVAFVPWNDLVLQLLGFSLSENWPRGYDREISSTVRSFRRLTDRRYLEIQPMRLEVITLSRDMSLEEFNRRYPSSVSIDKIALLNHLEPGGTLRRGTRAKRVVGTNPDSL